MASSQNRPLDTIKRRGEYGQYIDHQIEKTGRQVKLTEIFGCLFLLVVGLLVFFLAAAIIDHWIVPLRSLGRWGLLLLLIGGVTTFIIFRLVPLVFRRVNPVYSAHTIERHAPAMKNSLVNHLVLRQPGQGVSKGVLRAVEQQAAQRLSQAPVDSAVDRGRLIRLGYLLLALTAVAALYKFFSPKDPLATFGRIAAPWSDIDAPTRVVIEQVRHSANPGAASPGAANAGDPGPDWVYADQKALEVEAFVRGLKSGEPVTLYWSTEDGRVDKQPIVMRPQGNNDRRQFRCYLPDENIGLRQNVRFFVAAGDARSAEFRIEVRTPPVIAVKSVEYRYPAYTHKRAETRGGGGDITALVGTTVTLHAEANQPIKSATVDLGCDGTIDHAMQVTGQQATATFRLAIDSQGKGPTAYLVRMANAQGHENPQPIRYSLEVVPDRSPTMKIVEPAARELQVPLNGSLPIVLQASDPDFALSSVHVSGAPADSASNLLFNTPIFEEDAAGFTREFNSADSPFDFRPESKQLSRPLKVGDVVHLWATARDNKHNLKDELEPNVAQSEKLIVHVVAPTNEPRDKMQPKNQPDKKQPDPSQKEQPKDNKQPGGGNDEKQAEKKQDDSKKGKEKGKEKQGDEKSAEKKQGGAEKKQSGEKQGSEKQEGEKSKEQPKSDNGSKDMNQLFDQIHREAQKEKQAKEKQPPEGGAGKQKGGGESSPPPDGAKTPNDQSPQPGSGSNKKQGNNTPKPDGGGNSSPERLPDPKTGDPGSASAGKPNDNVGSNKTAGEKFTGGTSKKGNDTQSVDTPPSNPSKERSKDDDATPGKAAKSPTKSPDVNPKANEKAKGDAGAAKATNPGEAKKKEDQKSDPSDGHKKGGNPNDLDSAPNSANASKQNEGSPASLSDTTTKVNSKAIEKKRSNEETPKDTAVAPSVNAEQGKNTNESGTNDGEMKGGSKQGGGARGNKQGSGQGGTNTEADEGKGAGKSPGTGETGKAPGNKVKSDTPTGSSGNETGNGSSTTQGSKSPGAAKSRPDQPPQGGSDDAGSTGGGDKQDPSGGRSAPQTGPGDGKRQLEETKPTDPDLEAAKKAADLVLDYIKDHPDEERFKEPRIVELANRLRAMRDAANQAGPAGDVARHQLRGLSQGFSTRGMKRDDPSGLSELRGGRELPGYSREYLERSGARPARKQP